MSFLDQIIDETKDVIETARTSSVQTSEIKPESENSIETQIRQAFDGYDVSMRRLDLNLPDRVVNTPHFGLFLPQKDWHCIDNTVKKGYSPHTIDDVVALTTAATSVFDGDTKVRCHWKNGHYVEVTPSDEFRRSVYGTADNVFPRLYVRAGYDGKAFEGSLGWYRDTCSNLAMLRAAGRCASRKLRHTVALPDRMDELVEEFTEIAAMWDDTVDAIAEMESREVNLASFIRSVYPDTGSDSKRAKTISENRVEKILRRIVTDRMNTGRPDITNYEDARVSAWEAYNGIQGYVQHDQRRKLDNPWDRAILSFNDPAVAKAETLALTADSQEISVAV